VLLDQALLYEFESVWEIRDFFRAEFPLLASWVAGRMSDRPKSVKLLGSLATVFSEYGDALPDGPGLALGQAGDDYDGIVG
jgi:hypothetical protein